MTKEELKLYLPKYLSADSKNALLDALDEFPKLSIDKFYTYKLKDEKVIYQGDGFTHFLYVELPTTDIDVVNALVLSNTCDIASENIRLFQSRMTYSPIINLEKYVGILRSEGFDPERIKGHVDSIKNQQITQILYLPALHGAIDESIVFFDKVLNVDPDHVHSDDIISRRIFSLGNYGHYILLLKLSFHFCRFQEHVDRN